MTRFEKDVKEIREGNEIEVLKRRKAELEEFYKKAKDADYLIYNSTIDGGVKSVDELIEKCSVLSDFKAVKSGDVWCTEKDVYLQSMSIGFLIEDIHNMLQGADDKEMNYLYRLD